MMDIAARMKYLAEQVLEHRRRYYILDQPTISDAEYDALERELRQLESEYPLLADPNSPTNRVGAAPLSHFDKTGHGIPMLSLDNAYSETDLRDWEGRVNRGLSHDAEPTYSADLKVDGLSLALRYEGRVLAKAITRGDGEVGEDVTENARAIADIPLELPLGAPESLEVRGEVFLSRKRWEELNTERDAKGGQRFANPRNAASGTMKLLDSREVAKRKLQFMPWQILGADDHAVAMQALSKWGFATMPAGADGDIDAIIAFINEQQDARLKLPFDTDGIVIKVRQAEYQRVLGATDHHPRWAIAYKYPATQATSTLLGITWQVGRTGILTPVAELEPVELDGSTIKRATLHNAYNLKNLGICVGCRVFIEKGGDVIPKVVAVVHDSIPENAKMPELPLTCPICSDTIVKKMKDVFCCQNEECVKYKEAIDIVPSLECSECSGPVAKKTKIINRCQNLKCRIIYVSMKRNSCPRCNGSTVNDTIDIIKCQNNECSKSKSNTTVMDGTFCPKCKKAAVKDKTITLHCQNDECPATFQARLFH
jgi:DNA ligase (NAD+)